MKRMISLLLVIAMAISLFGVSASAAPTVVYGDLDGDGSVTASDARLTLRYSVHLENAASLAAVCKKTGYNSIKAADVNADGEVTASDARMILRASVNLEYKPALGMNESEIYLARHFTMDCMISTLDYDLTCAYTDETVYTKLKMDLASVFGVEGKEGNPVDIAILSNKESTYIVLPEAKMAMDFSAFGSSETAGSSTIVSLFDDVLVTGRYDLEPDRIESKVVDGKEMTVYTFNDRDEDGEETGGCAKHYLNAGKLVRVENYEPDKNDTPVLSNTIQIKSLSASVPTSQTTIPDDFSIAKNEGSAMLFMLNMLSLAGLTLADIGMTDN